MKKYIALLLTLIVAFSMCACGTDAPTQGTIPTQPTPGIHVTQPTQNAPTVPTTASAPTQEELDILKAYENALKDLKTFPNIKEEYTDCYNTLMSLDLSVIDKWLGTEYTGPGVNWDYKSVMGCFTVHENMLLEQRWSEIDALGNVTDYAFSTVTWTYDMEGRILEVVNEHNAVDFLKSNYYSATGKREYTCDESGRVTQIRYLSGIQVNYLVTMTYDTNGNKIKETVTDYTGDTFDVHFTYDDQNRLVYVAEEKYGKGYGYAYDDKGNLITSVVENTDGIGQKITVTYQLDANGKAESAVYRLEFYSKSVFAAEPILDNYREDQYAFTYDADENLVKLAITYGATYYGSGDEAGQIKEDAFHYTTIYEYVYGDDVTYTPAQ